MYCDYRHEKLRENPSIIFRKKLHSAIASITQDFSFAHLKEAFDATLSAIAGNISENGAKGGGYEEGGDLDVYELWREMKTQVRLLREDMDTKHHVQESIAPAAFSNLPFRPRASGAARNLINPPHMIVDCDSRHAPIMTDKGMFLDSRFNLCNLVGGDDGY